MSQQAGIGMQTNRITGEIPSGTLDFSNKTFTLATVPANGNLELKLNGIDCLQGVDFTLSGLTITFIDAPHPNDILFANYIF